MERSAARQPSGLYRLAGIRGQSEAPARKRTYEEELRTQGRSRRPRLADRTDAVRSLGRMMRVFYGMGKGNAHRYQCRGDDGHVGAGLCIGIGGVRIAWYGCRLRVSSRQPAGREQASSRRLSATSTTNQWINNTASLCRSTGCAARPATTRPGRRSASRRCANASGWPNTVQPELDPASGRRADAVHQPQPALEEDAISRSAGYRPVLTCGTRTSL